MCVILFVSKGDIYMKTATRVMYTIGKIFSIIELIGFLLMVVGGIIMIVAAPAIAEQSEQYADATAAIAAGTSLIVFGLIYAVIVILTIALVNNAHRKIKAGDRRKFPHILVMVMGFVSGDIFYFLGGLFGLIAA